MVSVFSRLELLGKDGIFGDGKFLQITQQSEDGKGAQYASELMFARVDLLCDSGAIKKIPIVAKIQAADDIREKMGTNEQFATEVVMYEKILPQLSKVSDIYPKFYYGVGTNGADPKSDIIILEDLRPLGYKVPKEVFLDNTHVHLTLKKLGEFHGLSYRLKKTSPEVLKGLQNLTYPSGRLAEGEWEFMGEWVTRGLKPLMEDTALGRTVTKVNEKLRKAILKSTIWDDFKNPVEPFAAIIHGDFNRNNVMYSYDNDGHVTNVKFFDFATALYGDPVVDLTFFLYINTSPAARDENWDNYLRIYWDGITSIIADPGFTFDQFYKHLSERAIYGYLPCSFFLPMMLYPEINDRSMQIFKMTREEMIEFTNTAGGDKATKCITDIVRHLAEKGYLEQYLLNFKH